jgi:uncharacterized repeat protein (TIGR03806 family)
MRLTLFSALALSALAAALACGSSSGDEGAGGSGAVDGSRDPGSSSGTSSGSSSSGADAKPPPIPRDFPLGTPSVGGYKLADAYPANVVYVPAALVWPKIAGAAPFALERMGQIIRVGTAREEVLDFEDAVHMEGEGGALGLALHPEFGDGTSTKPYAYVWYNAIGSKQRLSRFSWNAGTQKFDRGSEQILLELPETKTEHNGGRVAFGPDGFLYFSNGDDLNPANHQTVSRAPFTGIFRIDVDMKGGAVSHPPPRQPEGGSSQGYSIPNDNPFVGMPNAIEEYWALGLRNPFGFSFDRQTGELWAGDVGDSWREEVNLIVKGGNYEFPYREGEIVRGPGTITIGQAQGPKYVYTHSSMADLTAILGGFVYRGTELPELTGKYIYSDWPSSRVWALDFSKSPPTRTTLVENDFGRQPVGLAESESGEIYALFIGGITKLTRDTTKDLIPKTLSETKIWKDLAAGVLTDEFVPYGINSPLWSDAAEKKRFISVPPGKQITVDAQGAFVFPVGTRLVKTFELGADVNPKNRSRRLEVRVLVVGEKTTYGLGYRWNADATDGDLVTEPTDEGIEDSAGGQTRTWHYPSAGECWSCHREENRVLGFNARQLNLVRADGTKQLDALAAASVFDPASVSAFPDGLTRPNDTSAQLEARALAYLAANCSGCHHDGSYVMGSLGTWKGEPGVPLDQRGLIGAPHHNFPMAQAFGLGAAPLIDPGKPSSSILLERLKATDEKLRMPPLGRNIVDPEGAALIEAWIASMTP